MYKGKNEILSGRWISRGIVEPKTRKGYYADYEQRMLTASRTTIMGLKCAYFDCQWWFLG